MRCVEEWGGFEVSVAWGSWEVQRRRKEMQEEEEVEEEVLQFELEEVSFSLGVRKLGG